MQILSVLLYVGYFGNGGESHTEVLDENLAGGGYGGLIGDEGLAVLEGLLGGGVKEADAVVVADAKSLGDEDLEILDGGVGVELDGGGQVLKGFLGRCGRSARLHWILTEDREADCAYTGWSA